MIPDEKFSAENTARIAEKWADQLIPLVIPPSGDPAADKRAFSDEGKLIRQVCLFIVSYLTLRMRGSYINGAGGESLNVTGSVPRIPFFLLQKFIAVRAFRILKDLLYIGPDSAPDDPQNSTLSEWKLIEETIASIEAEYLNHLDEGSSGKPAPENESPNTSHVKILD